MTKKTIKTCLRKAIILHKKYTLDLEKLENKLGGEITFATNGYAELVLEKEWYSIYSCGDTRLKKHKFTKLNKG